MATILLVDDNADLRGVFDFSWRQTDIGSWKLRMGAKRFNTGGCMPLT